MPGDVIDSNNCCYSAVVVLCCLTGLLASQRSRGGKMLPYIDLKSPTHTCKNRLPHRTKSGANASYTHTNMT